MTDGLIPITPLVFLIFAFQIYLKSRVIDSERDTERRSKGGVEGREREGERQGGTMEEGVGGERRETFSWLVHAANGCNGRVQARSLEHHQVSQADGGVCKPLGHPPLPSH